MENPATPNGGETRLMGWLARWRAELMLSVRVTVAAIFAYALAALLALPQGYWALLTAVIVVQGSVGGSLKATVDRLIGTLGGAACGALVALLVPRDEPLSSMLAIALAVAPLAFLTALNASFRIAPVTAIIVLYGSTGQAAGPLISALDRVLEIGLGCVVGLVVSLLVLPARAHGLVTEAAGRLLGLLAELVPVHFAGLTGPQDQTPLQRYNDRVRAALNKLETVADEARRERAARLTDEPDPDALLRTLRRVRSDLVMAGRATSAPLPAPIIEILAGPTGTLASAIEAFLRATGAALVARAAAPSLEPVTQALARFTAAMAETRRAGLIRPLPTEAAGRIFGLAFALEQLCRDLDDLANRVTELAQVAPDRGHDKSRA